MAYHGIIWPSAAAWQPSGGGGGIETGSGGGGCGSVRWRVSGVAWRQRQQRAALRCASAIKARRQRQQTDMARRRMAACLAWHKGDVVDAAHGGGTIGEGGEIVKSAGNGSAKKNKRSSAESGGVSHRSGVSARRMAKA
jgi:hypothetical protein